MADRRDDDATRALLKTAVEDAWRWREIKAEEYPEDHRNSASAEALKAVADRLGMPDAPSPEPLTSLGGVLHQEGYDFEAFFLGGEVSRVLGRFHFDNDGREVTDDEIVDLASELHGVVLDDLLDLGGPLSDGLRGYLALHGRSVEDEQEEDDLDNRIEETFDDLARLLEERAKRPGPMEGPVLVSQHGDDFVEWRWTVLLGSVPRRIHVRVSKTLLAAPEDIKRCEGAADAIATQGRTAVEAVLRTLPVPERVLFFAGIDHPRYEPSED